MTELSPGAQVCVPCTIVSKGPLRDLLVSIETTKGLISGFVRSDFVFEDDGQAFVYAKIVSHRDSTSTVHLPGSFFTIAAGMAVMESARLNAA